MIKLRTLPSASLAACLAAGLPSKPASPVETAAVSRPGGTAIRSTWATPTAERSRSASCSICGPRWSRAISGQPIRDGGLTAAASFLQSAARLQQFSRGRLLDHLDGGLRRIDVLRRRAGAESECILPPPARCPTWPAWCGRHGAGSRTKRAARQRLRWVGLHNTVNDEDFVLPKFWRRGSASRCRSIPTLRRGLPPGCTPVGARVFDAVCAKDINGRPAVEAEGVSRPTGSIRRRPQARPPSKGSTGSVSIRTWPAISLIARWATCSSPAS